MDNQMNEWMPQSSTVQVTVEQLDKAVQRLKEARQKHDEKKKEAAEAHAVREEAEQDLVNLLKAAGRTKYEAEGIGLAYISTKEIYKVPADIGAKRALFKYIREKHGDDALMGLLGINHQTLNSWANQELEADPLVQIPGLEAPTSQETLNFRKK